MKKIILMAALLSTALWGHAQHKTLTQHEDSLLRTHYEEITKQTKIIADEIWYNKVIGFKMDGNSEDAKQLYYAIYECEMHKQLCNLTLGENLQERIKRKKIIDQQYEDKICRLMAPYWNMGLPNLYIAILNRKGLKLSETQYNDIVTHMIRLKSKAENTRESLWGDELQVLQEVLSGDQLDTYFRAKNARIATRDSRIFWERLKDEGMANDLDSTAAVSRIFVHRLKIMQASDIYWNNETKKREAWNAIDRYAPMEMRRVYSVDRKNRAKKQGYKGSFNW